jgi:hypothetical protein
MGSGIRRPTKHKTLPQPFHAAQHGGDRIKRGAVQQRIAAEKAEPG